jgi:hypothetical protein
MPISNSYQAYNTDGTTDPAGSFAYWTDPVFDTKTPAERRPRHQPEHGLLAGPAGHRGAPRGAGHRDPGALGAVHPGRLRRRRRGHGQRGAGEHRGGHPQGVRGRIAEAQQLNADPDRFKDAEVADYVGVGVHCAQGNAFCADAKGVKFGQTDPSPTR